MVRNLGKGKMRTNVRGKNRVIFFVSWTWSWLDFWNYDKVGHVLERTEATALVAKDIATVDVFDVLMMLLLVVEVLL